MVSAAKAIGIGNERSAVLTCRGCVHANITGHIETAVLRCELQLCAPVGFICIDTSKPAGAVTVTLAKQIMARYVKVCDAAVVPMVWVNGSRIAG